MGLPLYEAKREDGGRIFCGPAAIMAITGMPYEAIRARINDYRDRRHNQPIFGSSFDELRHVFELSGYEFKLLDDFPTKRKPTFKQWLPNRIPGVYNLVCLTHHWIVVAGNRVIDNHTQFPVSISDAPWKRARVKRVYEISPLK